METEDKQSSPLWPCLYVACITSTSVYNPSLPNVSPHLSFDCLANRVGKGSLEGNKLLNDLFHLTIIIPFSDTA